MAHFNFNLDDFADPNALNRAILGNQYNTTPAGKGMPIRTSDRASGVVRQSLTTRSVSDVLQGEVAFKPTDLAVTKFNEVLSSDAKKALTQTIAGVRANPTPYQAYLVGYDIGPVPKYDPNYTGAFTTAGGGNTPSSTPQPGDANVGQMTADGFVFPLRTTKTIIRNGYEGSAWPSENLNNVHHSYNAADIFAPPGTPVVAATNGTVRAAKEGGNLGWRVRIEGDNGLWTYYAHMKPGNGMVTSGQVVTAGTQLGIVGSSADAQGTTPHLHFDISPQDNSFSRGYGFANGPLLNPQPYLVEAFKGLPE